VRPSGYAAIQAIEEHGDEHRNARVFESQIDGRDDSVKTREQRCRGQQVRQPVDAPWPRLLLFDVAHEPP
jgi:hypothetical protein